MQLAPSEEHGFSMLEQEQDGGSVGSSAQPSAQTAPPDDTGADEDVHRPSATVRGSTCSASPARLSAGADGGDSVASASMLQASPDPLGPPASPAFSMRTAASAGSQDDEGALVDLVALGEASLGEHAVAATASAASDVVAGAEVGLTAGDEEIRDPGARADSAATDGGVDGQDVAHRGIGGNVEVEELFVDAVDNQTDIGLLDSVAAAELDTSSSSVKRPRGASGGDLLICAVCLDEIHEGERRSRAGRQTGCKHVFHWECIKQWFRVKAVCPVCNTPLFDHGIFEVDPVTGKERFHRIRPEGSLHTAAAEGNGQEIRRLVSSGASVNRTMVGDVAPLHVAAHHGHLEAIAELLAGRAAVNQPAQGGATALYIAAQNRHADIVARLITGRAHVNQAAESGGTPLHIAARSGHVEAVAWLIAGSADVDQAMDGGMTPLFLASQRGFTDIVVRLLAQGASANCLATDGATPLHFAALHGHTDVVARLLVGGGDVNKATHSGSTPLHVAAQSGHTEVVAWLLAGKARVNQEMVGGATPLFLAARGGHAEVIAWLLAKHAAVDQSTTTGATPLYIAAHGGHAEAIGRLMSGGAEVDRQAVDGATAMRVAVLNGQAEAIGRLLSGGAAAAPYDIWLSLFLGNVRGARRLAAASGYSWEMWRFGCMIGSGSSMALATLLAFSVFAVNAFEQVPGMPAVL